jgi:hypothetical protein
MTTPSYPSKRYYAAGFKLAPVATGAWGIAEALGAGCGILIENDGNPVLKQPYDSHDDIDAVMALDGDLGPIGAIDFPPDFAERYDPGPLGSMIAALFGTCPAPEGMYVVTASNNKIDVKEGAGEELTATLAAGTYTGTALAVLIAAALNAMVGKTLVWSCTYTLATNKFSIGIGSGTATLMWSTGTHKAIDISALCGYLDTADDTGAGPFPSDTAGLGTAMKHLLDWADEVTRFGTFAAERPGTIIEVPSAMPMKYDPKIAGGLLKSSIGLRGNTVIADSVVNEAAEMDALTYQDKGNRIKFSHGVLRMNAQEDAALAFGDVLEVSDIDPAFERTLDDVHGAGSDSIIQPKEKGFKMTIKITLPRTSAANLAHLATFKAMEAQKMDITFTSPVAAAPGVYYKRVYGFPRLKFSAPPAAPLADIMTTVLTFEAEQAAEAPDGMTGHVRPYIEMVNKQATGYLA